MPYSRVLLMQMEIRHVQLDFHFTHRYQKGTLLLQQEEHSHFPFISMTEIVQNTTLNTLEVTKNLSLCLTESISY